MMRDIFWPENLIRIRFLPLTILKVIAGVILAPAVLAGAGYLLFLIEPAWPRLMGRGIVPFMIVMLAFMVYLMPRFVIMLCADCFTAGRLIIKYQIPFRRSIRWKDISSIEIHHRTREIAVATEDGRRYELKGFRGTTLRDRDIINDDFVERSSYEYRFHGLSTGITLNQYMAKLRKHIPDDIIISM